jgi:hypothetical protein
MITEPKRLSTPCTVVSHPLSMLMVANKGCGM